MGQYPDGLRGPLIIRDTEDPYKDEYDEEIILTCRLGIANRRQNL